MSLFESSKATHTAKRRLYFKPQFIQEKKLHYYFFLAEVGKCPGPVPWKTDPVSMYKWPWDTYGPAIASLNNFCMHFLQNFGKFSKLVARATCKEANRLERKLRKFLEHKMTLHHLGAVLSWQALVNLKQC